MSEEDLCTSFEEFIDWVEGKTEHLKVYKCTHIKD